MTTERLIIKRFAGLEDIDIEIKKINILIGPQASGKSIIAKVLFYFKSFVEEIFSQGIKRSTKLQLDRELKNKFEEYFPFEYWGNKDFYLRYSLGEEFIELKTTGATSKKSGLSISYSDFYVKSLSKIRRISKRVETNVTEQGSPNAMFSRLDMIFESQKSFLKEVSNQFGRESSFSQLFIPAGRSFFANLKNNIFSLLSENNAFDPFLVEFGDYYDFVKSRGMSHIKNDPDKKKQKQDLNKIGTIKKKILCGQYIKKQGEDYLMMSDGRQVKLSNCSSGQQEALPLTLILESLPFFGRGVTGQSTYIEEPEAHLFPSAQRDIVDLIATVYNLRKERLQFFITTHSPYILTAFNNLLQAGIIAKNVDQEKLEALIKIIPESKFLLANEVTAYSLEKGDCKSIIEIETGLINAEIIDAISQELALEFDELLELDF